MKYSEIATALSGPETPYDSKSAGGISPSSPHSKGGYQAPTQLDNFRQILKIRIKIQKVPPSIKHLQPAPILPSSEWRNEWNILIGCPSRKWMLWSTSPCLARRLSSQYFMMLWRSWTGAQLWREKKQKTRSQIFTAAGIPQTTRDCPQLWPLTCEVKKQSSLSMFS